MMETGDSPRPSLGRTERLLLVSAGVTLTLLCGLLLGVAGFAWPEPLTTAQATALDAAQLIFRAGALTILVLIGGSAVLSLLSGKGTSP